MHKSGKAILDCTGVIYLQSDALCTVTDMVLCAQCSCKPATGCLLLADVWQKLKKAKTGQKQG